MSAAPLGARIARLERTARRDRVFALGALTLALATAQAPASAPVTVGGATLAAAGLSVRDAARKTRTTFGLDASRAPALTQSDTTGALRQVLALVGDRPVLRQLDRSGKRRAEMFLAPDTQNGEFVVRDGRDVARAAAFIGAQGFPEMAFYGSDGKVRAYISSGDNAPYLVMKDTAGTSRVVMGTYASGRVGMDVRNAVGTPAWSKP